MHLSAALPILAVWTADVPKQMLDIYDRVVKEVALDMFAGYADIVPEMFVRIADLPIADSIRDLRYAEPTVDRLAQSVFLCTCTAPVCNG